VQRRERHRELVGRGLPGRGRGLELVPRRAVGQSAPSLGVVSAREHVREWAGRSPGRVATEDALGGRFHASMRSSGETEMMASPADEIVCSSRCFVSAISP